MLPEKPPFFPPRMMLKAVPGGLGTTGSIYS